MYGVVVGVIAVDRARGALLGTFVGDALGMPFEGAPPGAVPKCVEMQEARLGRGTYTDDTQMMIALAESLLERDGIDDEHLGAAFVAAFDPERGYGAGTRQVLALIASGVPAGTAAARVFDGQGSLGNGAAMRIAPVAVRFARERDRLLDAARCSAHATHAHPVGVDTARVQAAAIAAALRDEDPLAAGREAAQTAELRVGLEAVEILMRDCKAPVAPTEAAERLGNSSAGARSVPVALYAAVANERFDDAVSYAVRCGGDTDTIAAMAGAIAGARHGVSGIPVRWLDVLEDGAKGRRYVERLADRLALAAGVGH